MKQKLFKSISLLVILALLVPYGLEITNPPGASAALGQSQNQPVLWDDIRSHPCMNNVDVFSIGPDGQWRYSSGAITAWIEDELSSSNYPIEEFRFGDFDGNGKTDIFRVGSNNTWKISYDAAQPWADGFGSDVPLDQLRLGDFDGDGKTDVFSIRSDGRWRYSSGAMTAWIEDELTLSNFPIEEFRFGDFDGNGKTDIFRVGSNNTWKISYDAAQPWADGFGSDVPFDQLRFGDFDGDGKTDVFNVRSDGQWRYSSSATTAWIEDELSSSNYPIEEFRFGDFDGNGKTDIIRVGIDGTWKISYDAAQSWADGFGSDVPLDQLRFGNFDDLECKLYLPIVKRDPEYIPPVIPDTTEVLSEQTTQNLSSISNDGTVFTFSQTTSELKDVSPGDVIVADVVEEVAPDGFLRKVSSVAVSEGGQVIVETEDATLEDAIEDGSAFVSQTLSAEDVESETLADGVSLVTGSQSAEGFGFTYSLNKVLYDHDGNYYTKNDQVTAKGLLSLDQEFQFDAKIRRRKLKELYFGIITTEKTELKIESKFEISKNIRELIATKKFRPRVIWIGIVPVVIRPVISVYIGLDGSIYVGVSTGVSQEVSLKAGLKYDDGNWSTVANKFSKHPTFNPPTLFAGMSVKVYADVRLELLVYGLIGPYVGVTGYLNLEARLLPAPSWKLYFGLEVPVGFIGRVFKKDLFDKKLTVYNKQWLIAEGSFKPGAMVLIPAGEFQMGCDSPNLDDCTGDDELHTVYLDAYYIDKYEVTVGQYNECAKASACTPLKYCWEGYCSDPIYVNFPAAPENLRWQSAYDYCDWAGKRLPTEAEWEKAARGSSDTRNYPWGNEAPDCNRLNYWHGDYETGYSCGDGYPQEVGSYPSAVSPYGVHDMAGNLAEWVHDFYDPNYYQVSPYKNPLGPETGPLKVCRGGNYFATQYDVTVYRRNPDFYVWEGSIGIRCADDPVP